MRSKFVLRILPISILSGVFTTLVFLPFARTVESQTLLVREEFSPSYLSNSYAPFCTAFQTASQQNTVIKGKLGLVETDGTVIVRIDDKSSQIVYIDDSTKITRNGQPAGLSDFKPGDKVRAVVGANRKAIEFAATGP